MQKKADAWASAEMVGWIEEVQKGLSGLRGYHEGKLLNTRYGLSWGLLKLMRVQRGVLISGDNGAFPEVIQAMGGPDSAWAALSRRAFGLEGDPLADQVRAGLRLYALTAKLLEGVLRPEDRPIVEAAVTRIEVALS
jgi:hypothetical protein